MFVKENNLNYYLQLELEVLFQPGALVLQVGLLQLFKMNLRGKNIIFVRNISNRRGLSNW